MPNTTEWSPLRIYAARGKPKILPWQDALACVTVAAVVCWLWHTAARLPQYDWQWGLLCEFLINRDAAGALKPGLLLTGLFTTLRISFWTILFSFLLGGLLGILSVHKSFLRSLPATLYINLFRNTPPLVILFAAYFFAGNLLPVSALEDAIRQCPSLIRNLVSICIASPGQMDRMLAAVLALGCYQAAYVAEITRGAIEAVPTGQWDAAYALGFEKAAAIRLVILPQALRLLLPPLVGQFISTLKESALASLISLPDLTFQSLEIMAVSNMTFEIWIIAAAMYLIIGMLLAIPGRWLELRSQH